MPRPHQPVHLSTALVNVSVCLSVRLNVSDIQDTCQKNAAAALVVGRRDVAKVIPLSPVDHYRPL